MDFAFNEVQQDLGKGAREFFRRECPNEFVRKLYDGEREGVRSLWVKAAEQGYVGALVPEEFDGSALDTVDLMPIMEEAGRALMPGPLLETAALTVPLLVSAGTEEQKQKWLTEINSGEVIVTAAIKESNESNFPAGIQMLAVQEEDSFLLNGVKKWVVDADISDVLLVAARTQPGTGGEGITVFMIPADAPGITKIALPGLDRTHHFCHINMKDVKVGEDAVVGRVNEGWAPLDHAMNIATASLCCTMIGGAQMLMENIVEYAKTRIQFGVPIGKFQAVKHRCTDMKVMVESAKSVTYYAGWALSQNLATAGQAVSVAKSYISEAYSQIGMDCIQLHGGIGFTWENDTHLYLRRAKANQVQFGSPKYHRERILESLSW